MYVLNEDEYNVFKNDKKGRENQDDLKMNAFNRKFEQNKVLENNLEQKQWGKLSENIVPILKTGFQSSTNNSASSMSTLFDSIKSQFSTSLMGKALKLFTALCKLPSVEISSLGIKVDGQMLLGSLGEIINDLIRQKKTLIYDVTSLLNIGRKSPDFMTSLGNKEALAIIDYMNDQTTVDNESSRQQEPEGNVKSRVMPIGSSTPMQRTREEETESFGSPLSRLELSENRVEEDSPITKSQKKKRHREAQALRRQQKESLDSSFSTRQDGSGKRARKQNGKGKVASKRKQKANGKDNKRQKAAFKWLTNFS